MRRLVDAILYIDNVADMLAWFGESYPDRLNDEGDTVLGFSRTPTVSNGDARLVYVRMTDEETSIAEECQNITVLAHRPYETGVQDAIYADLFSDSEALALYDSVYDRTPYAEGGVTITPPDRFGQMG